MLIFAVTLVASAVVNGFGRHGAVPPAPAADELDAEPYQDALVLAAFSLPALIIIFLISSWSLRPLARASAEARSVGPLDPAARISRSGLPAEIVPLVDAVNGALDRMAEAVEAERRFTENAAHELRTPLAVLGLRLQRARQGGAATPDWPAIEQDLAHMNRLVGQLLDLARKENARRAGGGAMPVVNLSRLAREAAAMILPLAEAAGRDMVIELPESLAVRGQADDLRDAVCSLLENAVLHGAGTIGLHGATEAGDVVLVVSDAGAGVPPDMRESVFGRFRKGVHSEGSGLGLAIVREVALLHGGGVAFLAGNGCRVEMRLPKEEKKVLF